MMRAISLTLSPHRASGRLRTDTGGDYEAETDTGRLTWHVPEEVTGGASVLVTAAHHVPYESRALLPLGPNELEREVEPGLFTTDPLALTPQPLRLTVDGDRFRVHGQPFIVKGSTDFRLVEHVLRGQDIRPILQDRIALGCNWFRILSMKKNNTGWLLDPRQTGHRAAIETVCELLGEAGVFGQLCILADTRELMPDSGEQLAYVREICNLLLPYPWMIPQCWNELDHPTQKIDQPDQFPRPVQVSSRGPGTSDVQPRAPHWDFADYNARRSPPPPGAKPFNNLNPYEFHPVWPHPVPYLCNESVKPENYGFNPAYAAQMGRAARLGPGAVFHHACWNEPRVFTEAERACAAAFYGALA